MASFSIFKLPSAHRRDSKGGNSPQTHKKTHSFRNLSNNTAKFSTNSLVSLKVTAVLGDKNTREEITQMLFFPKN